MAPTQREQIERLASENADLKEKVNTLTETVSQLKAALDLLSVQHGGDYCPGRGSRGQSLQG